MTPNLSFSHSLPPYVLFSLSLSLLSFFLSLSHQSPDSLSQSPLSSISSSSISSLLYLLFLYLLFPLSPLSSISSFLYLLFYLLYLSSK